MPIVHEWSYDDPNWNYIWFGHFSGCHKYGDILTFVRSYLDSLPQSIYLYIPRGDGLVQQPGIHLITLSDIEEKELLVPPGATFLTLVLSRRNSNHPSIILAPLDDGLFTRPFALCDVTMVPWEQKQSKAFWRGKSTGDTLDSEPYNLRTKVVRALQENPNADVQFGQDTSIQTFLNYKYLLVLDGTCIASSLHWTFASGSVPILVTHPGNEWWFKRYIEPMKHYVPVNYDLSDLDDKLNWLLTYDDKAQEIATNAMQFSDYYLSSGFQKYHLENEIAGKLV